MPAGEIAPAEERWRETRLVWERAVREEPGCGEAVLAFLPQGSRTASGRILTGRIRPG